MKREVIVEKVLEKCPNTVLLTYAGSIAYGTQKENSDINIQGVCVPSKHTMFGLINFEQCEFEKEVHGFEGVVYNIKKFFQLAIDGNPSILETMFVEPGHILFKNAIGESILSIRKEFLSTRCYHFPTYGYVFSQPRRLRSRRLRKTSFWKEVGKFGYSLDDAYHLVRLSKMSIQVLTEGNLSVFRPERRLLLAIRGGEYTLDQMDSMVEDLEYTRKLSYVESRLRNKCDFEKLNNILVSILERTILLPNQN